tara:strand:- start:893 stop:1999 length:1107 start_codon:yes stop_codon:yes gene_type:complete
LQSVFALRRALTVVVRIPGCRRFDRFLSRILFLPPRFLSNRVSLPKHTVPGGLREQIQYWIWRRHSPSEAALTSLLIAVDIVLVALAIGVVFDVFSPPTEATFKWASPDLVGIAGYAGAIFGFLQAVLVFVAQIRSQQDSSMLPLTTMWARKYHAFEILALSAGVAIANLAVALLGPFLSSIGDPISWSTQLFAPMLAMNLILLPAMTALSLWMLASIMADAGNTDVQAIKPVLRAAMATAAIEDAKLIGGANLFAAELQAAGLKYNPFAHTGLNASKIAPTPLDTGKKGTFVDVDCVALQHFATLSKSIPGTSVEIAALPGQEWSALHGGVIKFEKEIQDKDGAAKCCSRLARSLRRVVILGARRSR